MTAKVVLPHAVFQRKTEPSGLPRNLRLRALEWALYFAVSGRHTAAELGRQMQTDSAETREALGRLVSLGFIEEKLLDATEYLRGLAATGDRSEKSLREFLVGVAQPGPTLVGAEAVAGDGPLSERSEVGRTKPPAPIPPPRIEETGPARPLVAEGAAEGRSVTLRPARPPVPVFGFQPLPSPGDESKESGPMPRSQKLSLRALMNLIASKAGSREAGQLDIYRVFVRVDTALLKRNGIETLSFTDDHLVADEELEKAIVNSVKKTLGLVCPESVWVEVA
jgi:hypothetical protein